MRTKDTSLRQTRKSGSYNASVIELRNGTPFGVFVAEVDSAGRMLRSNAVQCTGKEGTVEYDAYFRNTHPESTFRILLDDCAAYKSAIFGLALPPSYTEGMR